MKEYKSDKENAIRAKMEELRLFSHLDVSEAKLRRGALIALDLCKCHERNISPERLVALSLK